MILSKKFNVWGMTRKSELFLVLGLSLDLIISLLAADAYLGSTLIFFTFCVTFAIMWGLIWVGEKSYFYLFLSSFWLLGFWFKACVHLILGYAFVEPIGQFNSSGGEWDKVLIISQVAALAALIFRLIQIYFLGKRENNNFDTLSLKNVPNWYAYHSRFVWFFSIICIILVVIINSYFSINQAGLIPLYVFPYKINAVIAGLVNTGFAFWIAVLVWWDINLGKGLWFRVAGIIFSGFMCSISILSRGFFVFQVFHYLPSIYFNRTKLKISLKQFVLIFILFLLGAGCTATLTTVMRGPLYEGKDLFVQEEISTSGEEIGHAFQKVLTLLADRWVGLEGVMAVSSYPNKDMVLFFRGWNEKASYNQKPMFEYIANSIYVDPDYPNAEKYNFLSLPGLIAMLNYSGSLGVVFLGVIIFFIFFSFSEWCIIRFIGNPFVLSFFGMYAAVLVSQFGNLGLVIIQLIEITLILGFIFMIQNICISHKVRVN